MNQSNLLGLRWLSVLVLIHMSLLHSSPFDLSSAKRDFAYASSTATIRPIRLLVTLLMYSFQDWDAIDDLLSSYRSICESKQWQLKLVILTAAEWSDKSISWAEKNLYCYHISGSIPLEIWQYNRTVGLRLVDYSRLPTEKYINDFDVFYYGEGMFFMTLQLSPFTKEFTSCTYCVF